MHRSRFGRGAIAPYLSALVVASIGCGGESNQHQDGRSGAGGKGGAGGLAGGGTGAGGSDGSDAGAGSSPGGQAGTGGRGGEAGLDTPRFPCGDPQPVLDATTGLERCGGGYLRRSAPAHCPSALPRTTPVANYNPAVDTCERDSDCSTATYGALAHCAEREGGYARTCVAGCVEDDDCDTGRVCLCEEPAGRCVPSTCTTNADCGPSLDCASYASDPGCFSTAFACQVPSDACGGDADCAGTSVNVSFCVAQGGSRVCSTAQCTTP
jgi:hypothetical protein